MLWIASAGASPRLNEFIYDLSGQSDAHKEWVELCNPDDEPWSLAGWQLQYAGQSWDELLRFGDVEIAPGEYLSEGEDFVDGMWNAETATNGLRLVDAEGAVVDTVLYGEPNHFGLLDDRGSAEGPFAPDSGEDADESVGRWPDCTDSDLGSDWRVYPRPSRDLANPDPDAPADSGSEPPGDCGCGGGESLLFVALVRSWRRRWRAEPRPWHKVQPSLEES